MLIDSVLVSYDQINYDNWYPGYMMIIINQRRPNQTYYIIACDTLNWSFHKGGAVGTQSSSYGSLLSTSSLKLGAECFSRGFSKLHRHQLDVQSGRMKRQHETHVSRLMAHVMRLVIALVACCFFFAPIDGSYHLIKLHWQRFFTMAPTMKRKQERKGFSILMLSGTIRSM